MDERLKQIWAGFEDTTSRHLTGKGVDNIIVPHRADYAAADSQFLPEDFEAPSTRALEALHSERADQKKRFGRKKKKAAGASLSTENIETASAPAPGEAELIKGMRATAMRTERHEMDYETFLTSDEGKAAHKKNKKKRFGLF